MGFLLNPLVQKIGLAIGVMALIFFAYRSHVNSIEEAQALRDQNAQLTQVVKDMAELKKKTEKIEEANNDILTDVRSKNEVATTNYREVRTYLDTPAARENDRPASSPIKETLKLLRRNEDE